MKSDHLKESSSKLGRIALMQHEPLLCNLLKQFISFKSHSFYFPIKGADSSNAECEYIASENRLHIPLYEEDGSLLGVFMARGVHGNKVRSLLPFLPAICSLCVDNIKLYRKSLLDPVTGLYSKHHIYQTINTALDGMKSCFSNKLLEASNSHPSTSSDKNIVRDFAVTSGSSLRFTILVIRLNGLSDVVKEHGYARANQLLLELVTKLNQFSLSNLVIARSGEYEFTVFASGVGSNYCKELGHKIVTELDSVRVKNVLANTTYGINASAGYVICPRNTDGMANYSSWEQARILLRRARLAAAVAADWFFPEGGLDFKSFINGNYKKSSAGLGAVLSYDGILREGGRIIKLDAFSRMRLSIGSSAGVKTGQRFAVWGLNAKRKQKSSDVNWVPHLLNSHNSTSNSILSEMHYKGEILVIETSPAESLAELVFCDDPYLQPDIGDRITLLKNDSYNNVEEQVANDEDQATSGKLNQVEHYDASTGYLTRSAFIPSWCSKREECDSFLLVLARFGKPLNDKVSDKTVDDSDYLVASPDLETLSVSPSINEELGALDLSYSSNHELLSNSPSSEWEKLIASSARICSEHFGQNIIAGRYALNSFIFFIPSENLENVELLSRKIVEECKDKLGLTSAIGIAPHPFLTYSKLDAIKNVTKALDYALLLPEPHIGVLDSTALNISADRLFSDGDSLAAITEYSNSLLCDEENILAHNSLGIVLWRVGRVAEARARFEQALIISPNDVDTLYNLAHLCQTCGEDATAIKLYNKCLKISPNNVYSLYRLGQMAEQNSDYDKARLFYNKAVELPGGEALTRRALAKLSIQTGNLDDAREQLHEALIINSNDALALQLLADIYLECDEDPLVAESLLKHSLALRPDFKKSWLTLSRALESRGLHAEAREAIIRAGDI